MIWDWKKTETYKTAALKADLKYYKTMLPLYERKDRALAIIKMLEESLGEKPKKIIDVEWGTMGKPVFMEGEFSNAMTAMHTGLTLANDLMENLKNAQRPREIFSVAV